MKPLNFIFVNKMEALKFYWVTGTACQRLAVLVIREDQILANQALFDLAPRSSKDSLVFRMSYYCYFVSFGVG